MKPLARLAVCTVALAFVAMTAPRSAEAVCASGGTVSDPDDCIPVGKGGKDCFAEWSVTLANGNPPAPDSNGFPNKNVECIDNDPTCDRDVTPGQCTFSVGLCVNVVDTRFICTPTSADVFELTGPSEKDGLKKAHKNPFFRDNRANLLAEIESILPTAAANVCSDETTFVVPAKTKYSEGVAVYTKGKGKIGFKLSDTLNNKDSDTLKFTCAANESDDAVPDIDTQPIASARVIGSTTELIGGPMAMGQVGDYLIENDKARFIIRNYGRNFSFMLTYGGHLIDADIQRKTPVPGSPWGPPYPAGHDNFLAMTPLINISATDNPDTITVVNSGLTGGDALIRTEGPDDLFDAIDPDVAIRGFNSALGVPAPANDVNIPVDVVNEYSLKPGDHFLKMETIIENLTGAALPLYIGDYTEAGGQSEVVGPGLGFGTSAVRVGGDVTFDTDLPPLTFDYFGWIGFGKASGLSYGLLPALFNATGSFGQSGVFVPIYGQSLTGVLLSADAAVFSAPPSGMLSFTRWFAVSNNGMGEVLDARHKLFAREEIPLVVLGELGTTEVKPPKTGVLRGTVTSGGVPVDDARVVIVREPGDRGAQRGVVTAFQTRNGGFYQGTLPKGNGYVAMVHIPGHKYEGGAATPVKHIFNIGGGTTSVDFALPATGYVQVEVEDSNSDPISGKVSILGLDATPDPGIVETVPFLSATGNVFGYDGREKVEIYGLADARFVGPDGDSGVFALPPGSYHFVVSHGIEYDRYTSGLVSVPAGTPGSPTLISATLNRVVDTPGFISADHHVHALRSPDSTVSLHERVVTMLAEGVDYFVNTDHDFIHSMADEIAALELPSGATVDASTLIGNAPSDEITTFDSGHFNAYPLPVDTGSVTGGAVDWSDDTTPPGLGYPSDNAYDLTPDGFGQIVKGPPYNATVFQANHFNSGTLGYFRLHGIDTTQTPPQSNVDPEEVRLDPATTNTYTDELTALEIWIESSLDQNALAVGENMGDWFNMLNNFDSTNPLLRKAAVADSDTHSRVIVQAGGPRTYIASPTDDPGSIDPNDVATNLNAGRAILTSGPFVEVTLENENTLATASHALGDSQIVDSFEVIGIDRVRATIDIHSPTWAPFDKVEVFVSNVPSCATSAPNFVGATKNVCTPTKPVFDNHYLPFTPTVNTVAGVDGGSQLEATVGPFFINGPVNDVDYWVVVVVSGNMNTSTSMFPMNPQSLPRRRCAFDACESCNANSDCPGGGNSCVDDNTTLANIATNTASECGVRTLAITNPLWVNADGVAGYKGVTIP